ncbi:hypothetical protein RRG08_037969 [Elysia crispata]|uniref:Uncharacterized protein n=1 Tax=Elysia crispata TaxID=231223 RepID=A0AAE1ACE9_9GAST|nr:hypothetical protein RRG08_037969 [Elysia crispata]
MNHVEINQVLEKVVITHTPALARVFWYPFARFGPVEAIPWLGHPHPPPDISEPPRQYTQILPLRSAANCPRGIYPTLATGVAFPDLTDARGRAKSLQYGCDHNLAQKPASKWMPGIAVVTGEIMLMRIFYDS